MARQVGASRRRDAYVVVPLTDNISVHLYLFFTSLFFYLNNISICIICFFFAFILNLTLLTCTKPLDSLSFAHTNSQRGALNFPFESFLSIHSLILFYMLYIYTDAIKMPRTNCFFSLQSSFVQYSSCNPHVIPHHHVTFTNAI